MAFPIRFAFTVAVQNAKSYLMLGFGLASQVQDLYKWCVSRWCSSGCLGMYVSMLGVGLAFPVMMMMAMMRTMMYDDNDDDDYILGV